MNYFLILFVGFTLVACTSAPQPKHSDVSSVETQRTVASADDVYPAEDEITYKKLNVKGQQTVRGANLLRYEKQVGRLTCAKIVAKIDNVIVGYECILTDFEGDDYPPGDDQIYAALSTKEVPFGRGANSIRLQKIAGRLACTKVMSAERVVVGYECNM